MRLLTIYTCNNKEMSLSNCAFLTKNYKIKFSLIFKLIKYSISYILHNILTNII